MDVKKAQKLLDGTIAEYLHILWAKKLFLVRAFYYVLVIKMGKLSTETLRTSMCQRMSIK